MTKEELNKLYSASIYGQSIYFDTDSIKLKKPSLFRRIKRRVKQCPHLCFFCKYRNICDIT